MSHEMGENLPTDLPRPSNLPELDEIHLERERERERKEGEQTV